MSIERIFNERKFFGAVDIKYTLFRTKDEI